MYYKGGYFPGVFSPTVKFPGFYSRTPLIAELKYQVVIRPSHLMLAVFGIFQSRF